MKTQIGFTDYNDRRFSIDIEVKEKIGKKHNKDITLKSLNGKKYKTLAISGDCKGASGQIQGEIVPKTPTQRRLVEIWDRWHLNDMRAGCKEQTEALGKPLEYEKACKFLEERDLLVVRGYTYGQAWLTEPLPESIVKELQGVVKNINKDIELLHYDPEDLVKIPKSLTKYGKSKKGNFYVISSVGLPHMFMITQKHITKSSGIYLEPEVAPCGFSNCNLTYKEHETALLIYCKQEVENKNKELISYLTSIKLMAEQDNYSGFAFTTKLN